MNVQRFVRDGTLTLGSLGSARAVGLACRGHAAVPPLPGSRRLLREVSRPATPCAPLHTRAPSSSERAGLGCVQTAFSVFLNAWGCFLGSHLNFIMIG